MIDCNCLVSSSKMYSENKQILRPKMHLLGGFIPACLWFIKSKVCIILRLYVDLLICIRSLAKLPDSHGLFLNVVLGEKT